MPTRTPPFLTQLAVVFGALLVALVAPVGVRAQSSEPTKDATSNPCQFDPVIGRSLRCATAGQTVQWSVNSVNTTGSDQVVTIVDGAPIPAGCFVFDCNPADMAFFRNGMPAAMPPGLTCDSATGWTIPNVSWPSFTSIEVRFRTVLDPGLAAGASCANQAVIHFPVGFRQSVDPSFPCVTGPSAPTQLTICGAAPGEPAFTLVKTAEDPLGNPITAIGDVDAVCWRFHVENTGTGPGTFYFDDTFEPRLQGIFLDPGVQFDTGSCSVVGNYLSCTDVRMAEGTTDELRACTNLVCSDTITNVCNRGRIQVTNPTGLPEVFSIPCASCQSVPTCLTILTPDFSGGDKTSTLDDRNGNGCADSGDVVRYVATLRNTGTDTASDVLFLDPLQLNTTDAGDCEISTGGGPFQPCPAAPSVGFSVGSVAPGDPPVVIRFSVDVGAVDPMQPLCNDAAHISAPECDASGSLPLACVQTCGLGPHLQLGKNANNITFRLGDVVTYTLLVRSDGNAPVSNVVVTDVLAPCLTYLPGSLTMNLGGSAPAAVSDAADGDGGAFSASGSPTVTFRVDDFLRRAIAAGEDVELRFRATITGCEGQDVPNTVTATADALPGLQAGPITIHVLEPRPVPIVTKTVIPSGTVEPNQVLTYRVRVCNDRTGTADLTNIVVTDDLPACLTYESDTMRLEGVLMTDAADGDAAEFTGPAPGRITFRPTTLRPGECADFTFQARVTLSCGGTVVGNRALLTADGVGLTESSLAESPVAVYRLDKTVADLSGGAVVSGDTLEYRIEFCTGAPSPLQNFFLTDVIPGVLGQPVPSDCDAAYVPGSMTFESPPAGPRALTDRPGDDEGTFVTGPPASVVVNVSTLGSFACVIVRYRVQVDAACAAGQCLNDVANATWQTPAPQSLDTNLARLCVGAFSGLQMYRNVGRQSLSPTRGCEFGPRLRLFPCDAIPQFCQQEVAGVRWRMLGDNATLGNPVTFYELPGAGCCVASPSDDDYLTVRKSAGTDDLVLEILWGCP